MTESERPSTETTLPVAEADAPISPADEVKTIPNGVPLERPSSGGTVVDKSTDNQTQPSLDPESKKLIDQYHNKLLEYMDGPAEIYNDNNESDDDLSHISDVEEEGVKGEDDAIANEKRYDMDSEDAEKRDDMANSVASLEELKQEAAEDVDIGMICKIKNQYEGKPKCECCRNWVDEKPAALRVKETDHSAYAIVVRIQLSHKESEMKKTSTHSILVKSPLLRKALKTIFRGLPNLSLETSDVVFRAPFYPFVYRWDAFTCFTDAENDVTTKKHLELLKSVLQPELASVFSAIEDFEAHDAISFQDLWATYKPGSIIVSERYGAQCAFRLKANPDYEKTNSGRLILILECDYIDWDGKKFTWVTTYLSIDQYPGTKSLADLSVFPLRNHPQQEEIERALSQRGQRFQELLKSKTLSYDGVAYDLTVEDLSKNQSAELYHIRGRVVISPSSYFRANPHKTIKAAFESRGYQRSLRMIHSFRDDDSYTESKPDGESIADSPSPNSEEQHNLLVCRPLIRGFCLTSKKWLDFNVSNLEDIKWDEEIFKNLVIDSKMGSLLFSLIRAQAESKSTFDDFVRGKGRGLIILLHGPSGVGKTLTAEAVAETMKAPLYSLKAGELGRDPTNVQKQLKSAFEVCRTWQAVLLLDEADVFMEERSVDNLARNELVSIFLQEMEYYEGILLLTTNRIQAIDPAFQSRIHLSLPYQGLTEVSRRQVWKNLLDHVSHDIRDVSEIDLDALAKAELNGREIKNVIKTAVLFAEHQDQHLNKSHLDVVLDVWKMGRLATAS